MREPTVTLAISAYNEEKNIEKFLKSVLMQKEEGFILEKILVISDGSTDKTAAFVKSIKSPKVELREHKQRLGKSSRLNEIYTSLKSEILVQSDADVQLAHDYVIRDLVKPILENLKIGMCGGNPIPLHGKTFTEKAVNVTCEIYINFRKSVRGGNNKFSADGRLLAYRKNLVKNITVPSDMFANDVYTYFCCITQGYKYRFVESARVNFRSPQSLNDQISQNTRFLASPIRMSRYFPEELVKKETRVPKTLLYRSMLKQFIKHPLHCFYIFLINRYCQLNSIYLEKKLTAKWDIAETTKTLLTPK